MDTPGLVKLTDVVHSYLNETDQDVDSFFRYLQIVVEGLTSLNVKTSYGAKMYFTTPVNNIVYFPADCIMISMIGILVDGTIYSLTNDRNMALPDGDICGVEVLSDTNTNALMMPTTLNYAKGGGYNFVTYNIDKLNRRIIFQGNLADYQVVVVYKTSGVNLSGETYIPVNVVPVLKEYLNWTLTKRNPNAPSVAKRDAKIEYINARNDYVKQMHPFSVNDFLDAIYSGYGQGVKR